MIILGLGNPGAEYAGTRHNAGFELAEAARARWGNEPWRTRHQAQESRLRLRGRHHRLVRPLTYMNRSGQVAAALVRAGAAPGDFLVLMDDIDLPLGRLRIRPGGGSGGHLGLASVQEALGAAPVPRLRIGVGHPGGRGAVVGHVLGAFDATEQERFGQMLACGLDALAMILTRGVAAAMNQFNGQPAPWEASSAGAPEAGESPRKPDDWREEEGER